MTTFSTTRFLSAVSAVLITTTLNGGLLFMFDCVTQEAQVATTVVSLETVTIIGKRV